MDRFELRRQNFALDEDQEAVRDAFAEFFTKECPSSLVRAAEPLGYDQTLWKKATELGVASMGLPSGVGGDDATLVDLVLVAEEFGRRVAPIPFISQVVASRLLARLAASADVIAAAGAGDRLVTLALFPVRPGKRQLVPDAAIAADVIGCDGEQVALYTTAGPGQHVVNQGSTPLAWWQTDGATATVLGSGASAVQAYETARREWKLLMAAALIGMTEASLWLGVEFAKTRETMGVPIGSLQGVAFPLTDVITNVSAGRNLVWKAAWFAEYEPDVRPELPLLAFDFAARTATHGTTVSAHFQGGLGFTVEADASLFFLRSKGWSVLGGDPGDDAKLAARLITENLSSPSAATAH